MSLDFNGSRATPEEAAAVIAAIEQFLRDTAPSPAPAEPEPSAWVRPHFVKESSAHRCATVGSAVDSRAC